MEACDKWRAGQGQGEGPAGPAWLVAVGDSGGATSHALENWSYLKGGSGTSTSRVLLAMSDTSNLPGYPGWPLRNLLLLAAVWWRVREVEVVCVRDARGVGDPQRSLLLKVSLPQVPHGWFAARTQAGVPVEGLNLQGLKALAADGASNVGSAPEAVGWEANAEGKVAPR